MAHSSDPYLRPLLTLLFLFVIRYSSSESVNGFSSRCVYLSLSLVFDEVKNIRVLGQNGAESRIK